MLLASKNLKMKPQIKTHSQFGQKSQPALKMFSIWSHEHLLLFFMNDAGCHRNSKPRTKLTRRRRNQLKTQKYAILHLFLSILTHLYINTDRGTHTLGCFIFALFRFYHLCDYIVYWFFLEYFETSFLKFSKI